MVHYLRNWPNFSCIRSSCVHLTSSHARGPTAPPSPHLLFHATQAKEQETEMAWEQPFPQNFVGESETACAKPNKLGHEWCVSSHVHKTVHTSMFLHTGLMIRLNSKSNLNQIFSPAQEVILHFYSTHDIKGLNRKLNKGNKLTCMHHGCSELCTYAPMTAVISCHSKWWRSIWISFGYVRYCIRSIGSETKGC